MDKKFNYTSEDMETVYATITDSFALEGLTEDDEDDLDDYDPEDDDLDDVIDDDDDEEEYEDDEDPAEDEDDEYDDVVENVGISNMEDLLSIDEMDIEDLIKANIAQEALEAAFGVPEDNIDPAPDDRNSSVRIKDFVSVLDPRPDFEDKSADDILDLFEDEFLNDEDDV